MELNVWRDFSENESKLITASLALGTLGNKKLNAMKEAYALIDLKNNLDKNLPEVAVLCATIRNVMWEMNWSHLTIIPAVSFGGMLTIGTGEIMQRKGIYGIQSGFIVNNGSFAIRFLDQEGYRHFKED